MFAARAWRLSNSARRAPVTLQAQQLFPERDMPRLVVLSGRAGHGKDAVAGLLEHGHGFSRLAFAAPLKDGLAALFGIPRAHFDDTELKERAVEPWGRSPRELMQWLGTDVLRAEVDDQFFLARMEISLDELMARGRDIVVSDCRFDNEARFLVGRAAARAYSFDVCRVDAGDRLGKRAAVLRGATAAHITEAGLDPALVTRVVDNNGTFAELEARAGELAGH
jgi:hypothetical protein